MSVRRSLSKSKRKRGKYNHSKSVNLRENASIDTQNIVCPLPSCNKRLSKEYPYDCPIHYINWWNKTFQEGDTFNYMTGDEGKRFAGLYLYHGMGNGDYHSIDGNIYTCSNHEARQIAEHENVEYNYIDVFTGYR